MQKLKNSELLLSYIREGRTMTQREKLWLIVSLSIPSILAQISATVMFFIDASMVGHLGAKASAAIGLVETTGWLMGGLGSAANMGFSVQVAHFIGANDMEAARRVLRQSIVCCMIWALVISITALCISPYLPYWLGGNEEIAHDASLYFAIFGFSGIFFQMEGLAGSMLKCSGNMKIPSMLNIGMCVMDVVFNYIFIYILGMGVMGAAVGTGLAMLVTACAMMYFLIVKSKMLSLVGRPGSFKPKEDTIRTAVKIGAPMGLQHLLMGGAYIVSTMIVAPLGTIAMAAHCGGSYDTRRTGHRGRTEAAHTVVRPYVCGTGHRRDDADGRADVDLRPRTDGADVARRGGDCPGYAGASYRGVGRADVCGCHRLQRCVHRRWRHDHPSHYEPRIDVGCTSDTGCHPCSEVWTEGCLDGDGHRAALPWQHLPHPPVQRQMGRETENQVNMNKEPQINTEELIITEENICVNLLICVNRCNLWLKELL